MVKLPRSKGSYPLLVESSCNMGDHSELQKLSVEQQYTFIQTCASILKHVDNSRINTYNHYTVFEQ